MMIKYLFSSLEGDIALGPEDLARPFLITPSEHHPFLTLGDYFEAIKDFILEDHGKPLMAVIRERSNKDISQDSIQKILIRSEKHGVLYHLASVEIFFDISLSVPPHPAPLPQGSEGNMPVEIHIEDGKQSLCARHSVKLSVSTAVSEKGKGHLSHEFDILKFLDRTFDLPYLPRPCFARAIERHSGPLKQNLSMVLADWFEDYHEWHLSIDKASGKQRVCIWDLKNGHGFASKEESFEIFRQAAKILTLYYDTRNFNQIYPWHHAAGDFIVKNRNGIIDVRLTTARRYESFMGVFSDENVDPVIAIVYFFLNLTIRIRLDRLDGLGDTVWAGNFSVEAAIKGFFEALRIMETDGGYSPGKVDNLLSLIKSFSSEEIEKLLYSLLEMYRKDDPGDFPIIQSNLKGHVNRLYRTIQVF
ncbi:MAG: hypothetical protein JRJ86_03535 [Deltaproteobacteria bacterium]|nr:hypothetical protein [Deltaproteobacteria bacterium]MBW2118118.1 hypothetical protein [Deltaproteobacteria bacterium]MBW2344269.1 hypothetical protein [Deltaproteobacteria bacterium]